MKREKRGNCPHCHGFGMTPVNDIADATFIYRPDEELTWVAVFESFVEMIADGELELRPGELMYKAPSCRVCYGRRSVPKTNNPSSSD